MDRRPTRDLSTASGRYTIHDKDPSDRTELWETFCTGHGTWFPIAPSEVRFKTSLSGAQCAGEICPSPCDLRAPRRIGWDLAAKAATKPFPIVRKLSSECMRVLFRMHSSVNPHDSLFGDHGDLT